MAVLLVLHAVCGAVICHLLLSFVPQYAKTFREFAVPLPDMTIVVIRVSQWFAARWRALMPCLGAGDIAVMLFLNCRGRPRLMTAWGVSLWLAGILLIGLVALAVAMPMADLR